MIVKNVLLQAQEWFIPKSRKTSYGDRRRECINKEQLAKLKYKVYRR